MRTAAGSALATELLAPRDADILAVFGAGAQGRSHVELLARTRRLREVRIVSRSGTSAERLAARLSEAADTLTPEDRPGPPPVLRAVRDSAAALAGARLVVTATGSTGPVFDARDLEPGAHVNAVGSYRPDMQELDADLVRRARVVVDHREAAWAEAGDLVVPLEAGLIGRDVVAAELGEIVNGTAPGGPGNHDFTLFKSVGNAAQDIAIAQAAVAAVPNARASASGRPSEPARRRSRFRTRKSGGAGNHESKTPDGRRSSGSSSSARPCGVRQAAALPPNGRRPAVAAAGSRSCSASWATPRSRSRGRGAAGGGAGTPPPA